MRSPSRLIGGRCLTSRSPLRVKAGDLLGIQVLDHVIIGDGGRSTSFALQGMMRIP